MTPLLFFTWASLFTSQTYVASCAQYNQDKYPALIYGIPWEDTYFDGTKNVSWFTFCPASTEQEKKINDQVSITGNSLFLRNIHGPEDTFTVNICDEPFKFSTLYNSESHQYEIGYELYYEEDRIKCKDGAYFWETWCRQGDTPEKYQLNPLGVSKYHIYRLVNNKNEVINNDGNKKNLLNDGSSKWIFRWKSVMKITSSGDNKQIKIVNGFDENYECEPQIAHFHPPYAVLQSKCDDYGLPGMDLKIYISSENSHNSKESQNQALSSIKKLKPLSGELYGSLKLLQIIPLWWFGKSWAKAASCSHMNMIPIWRSIAGGQLRRVDLYILALAHKIRNFSNWYLRNAYFGASGVLTYKNESGIDSNQQRKLYSMPDNSNFSQIIPVPKVIYRVIEAVHVKAFYAAIIVIHNDPNPVSDRDRICNESEEVSGWEAIKNDDPRTGITYVCPYTATKVEHVKLGFQGKNNAIQELSLNSMVHYGWDELRCEEYRNRTSEINQEFEELLDITADISF